eukprot:3777116-Rhodomonas_salina.1
MESSVLTDHDPAEQPAVIRMPNLNLNVHAHCVAEDKQHTLHTRFQENPWLGVDGSVFFERNRVPEGRGQ